MALSAEQREKIVEMYRAGKKTAEITKATGAARSSIYFVLTEEGVTPTRQRSPKPATVLPSGREITPSEHTRLLDWALTRVTELENENGSLRERIRTGRAALGDD